MRAPRAGWIGRSLALGLAVVTLTGCLPADQSAVAFDESTERPVLLLALCSDERVEAVRLAAVEDRGSFYEERETVWRIEARPAQAVTQVVLGEAPEGFEVVTPIAAELPANLVFVAELAGGTVSETDTGPFSVDEALRDDIAAVRDELAQGAAQNDGVRVTVQPRALRHFFSARSAHKTRSMLRRSVLWPRRTAKPLCVNPQFRRRLRARRWEPLAEPEVAS